ncbi:acyltransferase family protein [Manganibacter manganicus]|uniref:Acyltransferase 3 domain-containing protein n=1 Tax=Manganibacter manganicus TaxID=1873176 RepID=A0A1V8RSU2_9HYPH|nr:acyltransferase family protein [Pseudaminobacter manganicus]OQM76223.1 hypothetical protein BFN67_15115 [Pseudaminobacter manganicus]
MGGTLGGLMRYKGLQVGRGLAALMVVVFHSQLMLLHFPASAVWKPPFIGAYGFYGVQFFFGISSFIIFEVVSRPSFRAGSFLLKRFFRLWPPYVLSSTYTIRGAKNVRVKNNTLSTSDDAPTNAAFWYKDNDAADGTDPTGYTTNTYYRLKNNVGRADAASA